MIGAVLARHGVAKREHGGLVRDVGERRGDARPARRGALAERLRLRHRLLGDVADRDVASLGRELPRELAAHARAAARDHGDLAREALHRPTSSRPTIPAFRVAMRAEIGSITARSRRAGSSEASIQNAGSNAKNATSAPGGQRVAQRLFGERRSGRRADHEHEVRSQLAPAVRADRETRLFTGMRHAGPARDLDQVRLEAVSARDHERIEAHHGDDARPRLAARRSADPRERAREGGLKAARLVRTHERASDVANEREARPRNRAERTARSERRARWSAAAAGSPGGGPPGRAPDRARARGRPRDPPRAARRARGAAPRRRRRPRAGSRRPWRARNGLRGERGTPRG